MGTKPALARQSDIERAVRALKAAGHEHVRVVFTTNGVVVEPMNGPAFPLDIRPEEQKPETIYRL